MFLSECKIGEIVRRTNSETVGECEIGHIVGLILNPSGYAIPVVKFADGKQYAIEENNLELYND